MQQRFVGAILAASVVLLAACTSDSAEQPAAERVTPPNSSPSSVATSRPPSSHTSARPARTKKHRSAEPAPSTSSAAPKPRAAALPLPFHTGSATQVITVTAASTSGTQGTLQAWRKVAGGWRRVGVAVPAWLGSDGITRHPSESLSATPIGSFTLTRAFGRDADPGTSLPYTRTAPADWWISQSGPLYNTMQHCASSCPFSLGDPNEHLYYTVPYYRYAVVIDYNTRNAPGGVVQGAGSAFFLHVTVGAPTAGCVSIAQDQLVRIMRWLSPARHPRILIGLRSR